MRIVFFGTPDFAAHILSALVAQGVEIVALVSRPDRPQGRSSQLQPTAVKKVALQLLPHVPLYQPQRASTPEFIETLSLLKPDLFVVAAYSEILKENLLRVPRFDCINVHGSLLPKYRGAAPIQRALIAGERETGITIISMVRELDAGDMLGIKKIEINSEWNAGELSLQLAPLGAEAVGEVIQHFSSGEVTRVPQDALQATFAPKLTSAEGLMQWANHSATSLHNHVRGFTPNPGAWCWVTMRTLQKRWNIKKTEVIPGNFNVPPGTLLPSDRFTIIIACKEGALSLLSIQPEGKKEMSTREFLQGFSKKDLGFLPL